VRGRGERQHPVWPALFTALLLLLPFLSLSLCPSACRTRKKLKPPQVMRVGTTRTAWVNFKEM
jgi:hypothetical protein